MQPGLDTEKFRQWGKRMVDIVADYWASLPSRDPESAVRPGYMRSLLPAEAPEEPESWEKIIADIEPVIMSGSTHWHHPRFFAYFPTGISYPSVIADILSGGIGCMGFTWTSNPSCTELEMIMMDWLAKLLKLPEYFLFTHPGPGGGMIQSAASECTLFTLLAAKKTALDSHMAQDGSCQLSRDKLVAYCSDQAHSGVERAGLFADVLIRKLESDECFSLRGSTLKSAILEDISKGLTPIYLCATLGTTSSCGFDALSELGPVCQEHHIWFHVDAAYAGSACICPEYRHYLNGVEYVDSFNFNPHKALLVNFDCSAIWFKDARLIEKAFLVNPPYLRHEYQNVVPDFRNWQIPLGRRFRSLKLWFVLRSIGVRGLQETIRKAVRLATKFANYVRADNRFDVIEPVALGVVCFALKGSNEDNRRLLELILKDRKVYMIGTMLRQKFVIRFSVNSQLTEAADIDFVWQTIVKAAESVINK